VSSGRSSRAKGVNGERESADVFRRYGFEVVRLQNNVLDAGDFLAVLEHRGYGKWEGAFLVDAKRRERLNLVAASKQVEAVARDGQVPAVAYRPNREPWRVSLRLEDFARLLGGAS
jgi:Holliday junction resolvase